jgi:hypothetical protein
VGKIGLEDRRSRCCVEIIFAAARRLKLKVNREKSSIRHAADATLLGFGFYFDGPQVRIRVAPKAIRRLKGQLRVLTGPRTPTSASSTSAIRTYCATPRCSAR